MDINWFTKKSEENENGFLELCKTLNESATKQIFTSDFVKYVLMEFWDPYYKKLLWQQFLPYVAGLIIA